METFESGDLHACGDFDNRVTENACENARVNGENEHLNEYKCLHVSADSHMINWLSCDA